MMGVKLAVLVLLSSHIAGTAQAHELRPAVADAKVGAQTVTLTITINAEAMLAGVDQSASTDTNDVPQAAAYDALRALPDSALADQFQAAWADLSQGFVVTSGSAAVPLSLKAVAVTPQPDVELPRDTVVTLTGALPQGKDGVAVGWIAAYGPLVIRQVDAGDTGYQGFLNPGDTSPEMARGSGTCGWVAARLGRC